MTVIANPQSLFLISSSITPEAPVVEWLVGQRGEDWNYTHRSTASLQLLLSRSPDSLPLACSALTLVDVDPGWRWVVWCCQFLADMGLRSGQLHFQSRVSVVCVEAFQKATHRKDDLKLVCADQRMNLHLLDHFPFVKQLLVRLRTTPLLQYGSYFHLFGHLNEPHCCLTAKMF